MKKIIPLVALVAVVAGYFALTQDRVSWKTVESSALNLSFTYPVHSALAANPLKGTVTDVIAYDHLPDGFGDWTISTEVKNQVIAAMNCGPLRASGTYLPVDTTKTMQCGVVVGSGGMVTVYAVGVGHPFEGTAFPESVLLTLKEKEATLLSKATPFTLIEKEANDAVTAFTVAHPKSVIWPPDANAKTLYDQIDAIVAKAVSTPTEEVTQAMQLLRMMAQSVRELPPATAGTESGASL